MSSESQPQTSMILYQTEDGRTHIQCRFENETIWLSQALIAELFQKDVRTINEHLGNIFEEGELNPEATVRKFRIVRLEGSRQVSREVEYYSFRRNSQVESGDGIRSLSYSDRYSAAFGGRGF